MGNQKFKENHYRLNLQAQAQKLHTNAHAIRIKKGSRGTMHDEAEVVASLFHSVRRSERCRLKDCTAPHVRMTVADASSPPVREGGSQNDLSRDSAEMLHSHCTKAQAVL